MSENDGIRFYARTEASGGHPQVRLRMEYRKPTVREGLKTASALILTEFDCARGMSRDLEISGFPRNNMKGDPQTLRPELDWSPVDMDAAIGTLFKIACPKPAA